MLIMYSNTVHVPICISDYPIKGIWDKQISNIHTMWLLIKNYHYRLGLENKQISQQQVNNWIDKTVETSLRTYSKDFTYDITKHESK